MNYEECYNLILDNFKKSINTSDQKLQIKILNSMIEWYKRNFEEDIKRYFEEDNQIAIRTSLKEIARVCKLDDISKMKVTYYDKDYEDFRRISQKIFNLAYDSAERKAISFDEKKYDEYITKINDFENKISSLFKNEYERERSECILDLEYLKNQGKVRAYSFRLNNLIIGKEEK